MRGLLFDSDVPPIVTDHGKKLNYSSSLRVFQRIITPFLRNILDFTAYEVKPFSMPLAAEISKFYHIW